MEHVLMKQITNAWMGAGTGHATACTIHMALGLRKHCQQHKKVRHNYCRRNMPCDRGMRWPAACISIVPVAVHLVAVHPCLDAQIAHIYLTCTACHIPEQQGPILQLHPAPGPHAWMWLMLG